MRNSPEEIESAAVLVVDDDASMRTLLKDVLEQHGHRVLEGDGGEQAIPILESERVGVVVLDKEMPGMDGMDLLRTLRRRWPEIPVILITAFGGSRVAELALWSGAALYLEKPFRVAELLDAVRTVVR